MATVNPFDLLGDDDNDDPTQLIAAQQQKIASATKKAAPAAAGAAPTAGKLPSKPLPPSQAVREAKSNVGAPRGGGGGRGGPGRGRGGRGGAPFQDRDSGNGNANGFAGNYGGGGYGGGGYGGGGYGGGGAGAGGEDGGNRERTPYGGPRQPFRGGPRRGGYGNVDGEAGGDPERPRRTYERRSGTGRGNEVKRDGAGRGNWGSATDDAFQQETEENVNVDEKVVNPEKQTENDPPSAETGKENKEGQENQAEKEEDKEMTLEEYEKIREEKRKALVALKAEERKVEIDKELKSMQQLSLKKGNDEIFIKLGSDKEKKKEIADRDERVKKSLSINEFLKPAEGERYYSPGGRGRGRGRGERGPFRGGFGAAGGTANVASAPPIEDPGHFPTLGGK